jgi:hypothetical protein
MIPFPIVIFYRQVEIGIRHHYHHLPTLHITRTPVPIPKSEAYLAIYTPYLIEPKP